MKNTIRKYALLSLKAALISLAITAICAGINLFTFYTSRKLLLSLELSGGERIDWIGFGLDEMKEYPMWDADNPVVKSVTTLEFEPISFTISLILFFIIAFVVLNQINKMKRVK